MKRILFLCTGNYYRSRYAEAFFNHLAARAGLDWIAGSAGLRVRPDGVKNVGPISFLVAEALGRHGIPAAIPPRMPRQVTVAELDAADLIVALKEAEHRSLVESLHPAHAAAMTYWTIHDLDAAPPQVALRELEEQLAALVARLLTDDRAARSVG